MAALLICKRKRKSVGLALHRDRYRIRSFPIGNTMTQSALRNSLDDKFRRRFPNSPNSRGNRTMEPEHCAATVANGSSAGGKGLTELFAARAAAFTGSHGGRQNYYKELSADY